MKEDNIKYTVCTEGSDSNFHYLRVMLISLLKHNPWAGKDITIFTCDETPLSRHNRTILESICKNIKFHDIDPNIYASLNIKGAIRKSILPLLYKIEAFNLTENDVVLYVNSSSLCISSLDFVFSGKSEAMVANTGYISQDKRNPDFRKSKVDEFNTSLLLLSKSVLLENISSHILDRLSRIKNLTDKVIEKEIIDSLKIRQIEIGYFDLNRVIKKSRYTDSKYNNFLSIKKNVGLIQLDINFSRKNDSSRLMYRKIDAIWQSYNQQGEWNTGNFNQRVLNDYVELRFKKIKSPNFRMKNFTKKMNFHEIRKLKETNSKLDKVHGININKAKSIASDHSLANMTNYEAYMIYEKESDITVLDSEVDAKYKGEVVLSVVIPYFRAGYIGWVPFESLIRQENINFKWEIIVIEENFENPFGLDKILEYKDRLAKVGCSRIKYISIKKWLPLSAKWYFLVDACSSSSKIVAMNSSDIYCSKHRLSKQHSKLINGDKNWYKIGGNLVYDIGLDYHVKLISMDPKRSDTCSAAASMELMKKLPLACVKVNVDGWRYNTLKNVGIDFFYDNTMDLQSDTININGLNNLSLSRTKNVKNVKPPFKKCCDDLCNHIPIEISQKLIESKKHIVKHKKNRSNSKIKLR